MVTDNDNKRTEFLAKAEEAVINAAKSTDSEMRNIWLELAANFRRLAQYVEKSKL
jgi:hypothetical protein